MPGGSDSDPVFISSVGSETSFNWRVGFGSSLNFEGWIRINFPEDSDSAGTA